jgi:hypothetical protein
MKHRIQKDGFFATLGMTPPWYADAAIPRAVMLSEAKHPSVRRITDFRRNQ